MHYFNVSFIRNVIFKISDFDIFVFTLIRLEFICWQTVQESAILQGVVILEFHTKQVGQKRTDGLKGKGKPMGSIKHRGHKTINTF